MKWIKIENELPPVGVDILGANESWVEQCIFEGPKFKNKFSGVRFKNEFHPTHWMPLPEPPLTEEGLFPCLQK